MDDAHDAASTALWPAAVDNGAVASSTSFVWPAAATGSTQCRIPNVPSAPVPAKPGGTFTT